MPHKKTTTTTVTTTTSEIVGPTPDIEIAVILDKSGSMQAIRDDTIGGFNAFLAEQKKDLAKDGATARLSLTTFDYYPQTLISSRDIEMVKSLNRSNYIPSGGTALYDAIGQTISTLDKREDLPKKVMIVIITDGQENVSRTWNRTTATALIESKRKAGWAFLFLGVGIDAFAESSQIGIAHGQTLSIAPQHMGHYFAQTSGSATAYRTGTVYDSNTVGSMVAPDGSAHGS